MNTTAPTPHASTPAPPQPAAPWSQDGMAQRLRKPGWRDPRLIIGLVLMALGIGLGSAIINAASNTVTVYAAAKTLTEGAALEPGNLVAKEVRIPDHERHYLTPEATDATWWQSDPRLARTISAGELVPLSALTNETNSQLRPVTFSVGVGSSEEGLDVGTVVDLWHVSDANSDDEPRLLAQGLQVSGVSEESGPLALAGSKAVTVLIPLDDLKDVLHAKSSAGSVELVRQLGGETP